MPCVEEFEWEKLDHVIFTREQKTVFRYALKVVMVAELFVTEDTEFQIAGAVMLSVDALYRS